jgi:glycosyltransferase involved in cell wall biosynthesis
MTPAPSRILFVTHRGSRAGTEYHVLWLSQELCRRGWSVHLALSEGGDLVPEFLAAGIDVHLVPRRGSADPVYFQSLVGLVRRLSPDVVHAHSGRLAAMAARLAGVKAIVETRHGLGPSPRPAREARLCRLARRTLTVCDSDRKRLVEGGLDPGRVIAVPNGIPIDGEIPDRGQERAPFLAGFLRLGFLGRLTAQKNPLFLAEIVESLEGRGVRNWTLAIAGDGPLGPDLFSRLERIDSALSGTSAGSVHGPFGINFVTPRIRYLGETEGPDLLLSTCDFLCAPSTWEGQPLAILESMARGVVPVATPLPSLVELLGGNPAAGLLVPPNAAAWVDAILDLAAAPARREAVTREGRRRIEAEHGISRMVDRITDVYREAFASVRKR